MSPRDDRAFYKDYPDGKVPTIFVHRKGRDFSHYPNGIVDMVGYWAEAQEFGGVLFFDPRKPSKRDPLPDVRFLTPELCNLPLEALHMLIQLSTSDAIFFLRFQPQGRHILYY